MNRKIVKFIPKGTRTTDGSQFSSERCSSFSDPSSGQLSVSGVAGQHENRVVVICATNCYAELDAAFLRRFQRKIYVGLPDTAARHAYLAKAFGASPETAHLVSDVAHFEELVACTEGLSCSDLAHIVSEVGFRPIQELWGQRFWNLKGIEYGK